MMEVNDLVLKGFNYEKNFEKCKDYFKYLLGSIDGGRVIPNAVAR